MDLRQLRYFTVLAAHQNFARAAEVLRIAQPALSRQIRLLEEEFGLRLFDRHPRGATMTAEAALLLERSTFILRYAEQMKSDMTALRTSPGGPVALGLSPGLAGLLTAPLMARLLRSSPGLRLRVVEDFSPALNDLLVRGGVDLAILNGPGPIADVEATRVLSDALCLILPFDDPNITGADIELRHLHELPLILTGIAKSGIRRQLELAAGSADVTIRCIVEVTSISVAKTLINAGVGWTVHYAAAVKDEIAGGTLRAVPIRGLRLERSVAVPLGRPRSNAVQLLYQQLIGLMREMVLTGEWPHAELAESQLRPAFEGGDE